MRLHLPYIFRDDLANAQIRALDLENERQTKLIAQQVKESEARTKESETRTKLYETLIAAVEVCSINFFLVFY